MVVFGKSITFTTLKTEVRREPLCNSPFPDADHDDGEGDSERNRPRWNDPRFRWGTDGPVRRKTAEGSMHRKGMSRYDRLCRGGLSIETNRLSKVKTENKTMAKVGVIMGSISDWEVMSGAAETLEQFGVSYEKRIVSAHRTPDLLAEYAKRPASAALRSSLPVRAALPTCRA